jgi:hypothetical protein
MTETTKTAAPRPYRILAIAAALDAARARQDIPFDGLVPEGADDSVPTTVDVWPEPAWSVVYLLANGTNVGIELEPCAARLLAADLLLAAHAVEFGCGDDECQGCTACCGQAIPIPA